MRFRTVGWGAVILLLLSGTWLLWYRGWLAWSLLSSRAFWSAGVGLALGWKLGLVTLMLVLSLVHDVALSPSRARELDARPDGAAIRRRVVLLARFGAIAALGVVVAAVRLVRA
ncbi:MAG: CopD family protein [Gemmatimonadetes bacterium]|nr:CopD family protein [Gemmatimonadota bacterium]